MKWVRLEFSSLFLFISLLRSKRTMPSASDYFCFPETINTTNLYKKKKKERKKEKKRKKERRERDILKKGEIYMLFSLFSSYRWSCYVFSYINIYWNSPGRLAVKVNAIWRVWNIEFLWIRWKTMDQIIMQLVLAWMTLAQEHRWMFSWKALQLFNRALW